MELINQFKSVKRIKEASLEEIEKVVGIAKAAIIFKAFDNYDYKYWKLI